METEPKLDKETNEILVIQTSSLRRIIEETTTSTIKSVFKAIEEKKFEKPSDVLINPNETMQMLGITYATLISYVKQGKLKKYSVGRKKFYSKNEILEALGVNLQKNSN